MKYLIPLLIAVTTLSCNPSRKLDKLNEKHPELLAKFCKDTFPCVNSKIDTITNVEYDFIELQCPGYEPGNIDTIWLTHNKTQFVTGPTIVASEYKINTITKTIKDSAAIRSCELELITCNNKCNDLLEQNRKLQNKVTAKNRWIMWLIIALLLSIIGNILQFKKL
jgi:predicted nucleic acid-binding Zn ribbon protein